MAAPSTDERCPECDGRVFTTPSQFGMTTRTLDATPSSTGMFQIVFDGDRRFSKAVDRRKLPPAARAAVHLYDKHNCPVEGPAPTF